jgi:alkylation response protein AidB-like acyl-CoA dehydrogenase
MTLTTLRPATAPALPSPLPCSPRPAAGWADDAALQARLKGLGQRLATRSAALDREAAFPFENLADLKAEGLLAAVVPRAAGGGGANLAAARRIIGALGATEPATALVVTMTYLVQRALARPGSRWPVSLRDTLWRTAVEEGALANALRVEPALGSPARGGLPGTVATRVPQGWRLSGHKIYTTGIPALQWMLVHGRTEEPDGPRVGTFLVPRHAPGWRVVESWDHLGLRASGSHEVIFDDVLLPEDHAVDLRPPEAWAGNPDPDQQAWMAALLGAIYDGVARAARDWLLGFVNTRTPASLGAALATVPHIQQAVGEVEALLYSNETLLDRHVARVDAGNTPSVSDSALLKHLLCKQAIAAVEGALKISGNHGLSRHHPLERYHRDVLCSRIHTPQDDSALMAAGRSALAGVRR